MAPKIFKHGAFVLMATLIISTCSFAQANPLAPQTAENTTDHLDDTIFQKNKGTLKIQLKKLAVQINRLQLDKSRRTIVLSAKKLNKEFKDTFKDFGENFAGSFSGMVPDINANLQNLSVSVNSDRADDQDKMASGDVIERVKNYSKIYSVDGNDLLQIDNQFGKVTVNTWAKNEFKVDVQMKFSSDDADYVNHMISGSSVSDSKVGSIVSFRTNLPDYTNHNSNRHRSMEINYNVYMPAGNPIDIENKFGAVILPELSGKALVRVSYGTLKAESLTNGQNDLTIKFGDANIANFNTGKIEVAYGKLKMGTVNNIDADIKFSSISIDRLRGAADVSVKYGDGFRIGEIDRTVKNINVNAQFTKINFDFKQLENFNFDVTVKMGSFNYDDRVKVTSKSPSDDERGWSTTKNYKGYVGSNNSANKVTISASYTGVNFN